MSLSGAAWTEVPDSDADGDGADEREVTVTGLTNGTEYPFEVQALNSAGGGAAARTSATPAPRAPVALIRPSAPRGLRAAGSLYSGMALGLVKLSWEAPSNLGNTHLVRYEYRYAARELAVTLSPDSWDPLGTTYTVGTPATTTVRVRNRDPLLRVANATVREGPQAQLSFDVSLDRAAAETVTVDYATSDGTATAGADYTATSSTLSFAAGETQKTITVAVLDDAHDEGTETLTLTLSNARGAGLGDATATGWIVNTDPMPTAWLARFGRTGATQVLGLLDARFDAARAPASQLTLGGRPVNLSGLRGNKQGRADPDAGPAPADADPGPASSLDDMRGIADLNSGPAARHADPAAAPDPGVVGGGGEAPCWSGWPGGC